MFNGIRVLVQGNIRLGLGSHVCQKEPMCHPSHFPPVDDSVKMIDHLWPPILTSLPCPSAKVLSPELMDSFVSFSFQLQMKISSLKENSPSRVRL